MSGSRQEPWTLNLRFDRETARRARELQRYVRAHGSKIGRWIQECQRAERAILEHLTTRRNDWALEVVWEELTILSIGHQELSDSVEEMRAIIERMLQLIVEGSEVPTAVESDNKMHLDNLQDDFNEPSHVAKERETDPTPTGPGLVSIILCAFLAASSSILLGLLRHKSG